MSDLADLFDAYREAAKLHTVSNAAVARKSAKKLTHAMALSIEDLVNFGVHAKGRWDKIKLVDGD